MSDTLSENYSKLNKRYQEIKNQLADIEAKLAESEKQIKDAREAGNMAVDSWCKNRRKYEAQTAEMQNKLFILYSMLYETLEKQGCDNVASQIAQMTDWTYDKEADWLKGNRNYDQLKQQLAEKEKIEYTDTINFVETSEPDIVAKELDRLNEQLAESEKQRQLDHDKQLINNTFDKINSEYAKRLSAFMGTKISVSTAITKLDEVLDQIQGENND